MAIGLKLKCLLLFLQKSEISQKYFYFDDISYWLKSSKHFFLFSRKSPDFSVFANISVERITFLKITANLFKLPSAFVPVLHILYIRGKFRKTNISQIFEEINIFTKCFAKIFLNLAASKYFHTNVPLVSHVADQFCLFF